MLEFFEKDEIDWSDLKYQEFYQTLFQLKKDNRALWNGLAGGPMERVHTNDDKNIFSFTREKEGDKVFVVFNLSPDARRVTFNEGNFAGRYTQLFEQTEVEITETFSLDLEPWAYRVYYKGS